MAQPKTLPLILIEEGGLKAAGLTRPQAQWAAANGFAGQRGRLLPLPGEGGALAGYLFGVGAAASRPVLVTGLAASMLEAGRYRLEGAVGDATYAAL
ncbi:MAG: leucyl aminopeptidase family protein, partial [Devosia sp.]